MAILQALLALIGRSAGRILNAAFGWAVRALFGFTSGAQRVLLTGLVATAAAWPLLLVGIAFPRFASWLVAFVPLPARVPDLWLRLGWVALALLAPAALGIALAARQRADRPRESVWLRALRGYPTTLGLALAFWISFVTVPVQHLLAALRRHEDVYVPLMTEEHAYRDVAERVQKVLNAHGFELSRAHPGFALAAPTKILRALAGKALQDSVPKELAYFAGPRLSAALYPAGLLLRGRADDTALAEGLVVESLTWSDALQTTTPDAQQLERRIRAAWHEASPSLDGIVRALLDLHAPYEDWQTIYRQTLQLGRALDGEAQLLDGAGAKEEGDDSMESEQLSTVELVKEITAKGTELVKKEVELAIAEAKTDLRSELSMVKTLVAAGVAAIVTLNLLLIAAVFGLATVMSPWLAALALAGVALLLTAALAIVGWRMRVTQPLARTRKTVEEDVQWAKHQIA